MPSPMTDAEFSEETSGEQEQTGLGIGAIVGIVVGGVAVLAVIVFGGMCCYSRCVAPVPASGPVGPGGGAPGGGAGGGCAGET